MATCRSVLGPSKGVVHARRRTPSQQGGGGGTWSERGGGRGGGRRRAGEVVGVGEDGLPAPPSSGPEAGPCSLLPFPRWRGGSGTAPPALFPSSRSMAFLRHWPVSVMCVEEGLVDWAIALLAIGCEWMVDEKARVTLCRVNVGALDLSPPQGPCFLVPWPNASLPPCPHRLLRSPLSLSVSSDASKKE
jgi:hypothetical protein